MNPSRNDFRFHDHLRVRWAEVDMQKIVFNGHYLMYVDTAVAGYWRALALPYHPTMEQLQGDLYVRKATLEYTASARYDERLAVGIRCGRIGNSSMVLHAGVFRDDKCLVHGELVYVFADPATQTSRPVPDALRAALQAFEVGEPMVALQVGAWASQREAATDLRHAVFAQEQGIAAELMVDDKDAGAVHALAVNRLGVAVGSGRLMQAAPGVAQIGRMATHAGVRGAGVGMQVLQALMEAARARGDREVVLNAQSSAVPFYLRAGYAPQGPQFMEAGVSHQAMRRAL
jgi:YbgC/YbaW family acyl-CoA thioester hydrolase